MVITTEMREMRKVVLLYVYPNMELSRFLIIEQVSTVPAYQLGKLTRLNSVSLAVAPAAAEERAAPSSWKFV